MNWNRKSNNKYGAERSGGYDSKVERMVETKYRALERAGLISGLRRNTHSFLIIPAITESYVEEKQLKTKVKRIVKTKTIEKPAHYKSDFVYFDEETKEYVALEVKSWATKQRQDYGLRRKLFKWVLILHNRNIRLKTEDLSNLSVKSVLKALWQVVLHSKDVRKYPWRFEEIEV